ncbi:MAG: N-carbamoylputrescine amidase [Arcobacter sp.]|nr:MAG: N-carbamoylputrescine amidase [Arcobacter sp.]
MLNVAAIQMKMSTDHKANISKAVKMVSEAASKGANIILLPELFEGVYFCKDMDNKYFSWALPREEHPLLKEFSTLAKQLHVVLLVSYFEKAEDKYYNSLVVMDVDGGILENYRKTHIPDGPGYEEKFYFSPGNTGFKVYDTYYGKIGAGICWDQWFSETARSLALMGAELIFFPTAIGSEPEIKIDSKDHWQRVQMGHAAANIIPVIAANRTGVEEGASCSLTFFGSSFMTDHTGEKICEASRDKEEILYAQYDLKENAKLREYWALFKDRRPECYGSLVVSL